MNSCHVSTSLFNLKLFFRLRVNSFILVSSELLRTRTQILLHGGAIFISIIGFVGSSIIGVAVWLSVGFSAEELVQKLRRRTRWSFVVSIRGFHRKKFKLAQPISSEDLTFVQVKAPRRCFQNRHLCEAHPHDPERSLDSLDCCFQYGA